MLELLSKAESPMGVTAIARALELDKGNAHRILGNLIDLDYVVKDIDGGRYLATLKLWEYGSAIAARHPLKRAAQPFLRLLREQTDESAFISLLDDTEVLYLDRLDAPYPLYAQVQAGSRAPVFKTATGKALLAFQADAEGVLRRSVQRHAPATESEVIERLAELEQIRQLGYATSRDAAFIGTSAVAAPILRRAGEPYAAVAVGGASERFSGAHLQTAIQAVRNAAIGISEALGET